MSQQKLNALSPGLQAVVRLWISKGVAWDVIRRNLQADPGIVVSESTLRRWYGGGKPRASAPVTPPPAAPEEVTLQAQVEHLESELAASEREVKRLRKDSNRDVVLASIVERVATEHFTTGTTVQLRPCADFVKAGTPHEFLAHVSDLHYGEVVDPDLAMGLEYDTTIARRRMEYLRDKIIRYAELRPYPVDVLHLAVLGDMTSGNNHEDLDTTNEIGMVHQAFGVAEMLYQMVEEFHGVFPRVSVTVMTGNHGRIHKVPRHKQRFENWDFVAGLALQQMCRMGLDDSVTVDVPTGVTQIITVADHRVALTHGDGIKAANFAGIPFYGLKSRRDAMQAMLRSLDLPPVDQISIGHFHQPIWWPGDCNMLINGAIKGGDEFVQATRYAVTPAVQLLQEWHPKHGVAALNHIDLDHVQ